MSQGPSTFGIMITSSLWPTSLTISVRSSSTHGLSNALTRVQSDVSPKSPPLTASMKPRRAASLRSTGIASSRLPRRMSVCSAICGAFAAIFSFEKSRKWIIREGPNGISRGGSGASMAGGWKKWRGFLIAPNTSLGVRMGVEVRAAAAEDVDSLIDAYQWLFAPPGSDPPDWDERRAAVALRQAIESHDSAVLVADDDGR